MIYTTVRGETVLMGTPDRADAHARARAADPWDLQGSREAFFRSRLAERAPGAKFASLDEILDRMRLIKSPREIALLRESSHIAAVAHMEAMRSAEPGMYEYEIEAIGDYVFKAHNAWGPAYFGLTAAGKNAVWPHYHSAQAQLTSQVRQLEAENRALRDDLGFFEKLMPASSNEPTASGPPRTVVVCQRKPATTQSAVRACLIFSITRLPGW